MADASLCSGSGYSICVSAGYTDHGYGANSGNSYWHMYSGHNCTNYVAYVEQTVNGAPAPSIQLGNAWQWGHNEPHDNSPKPGSVAWWDQNVGGVGCDGHVAYVESVSASGAITVSEDAYPSGPFDWRVITPGSSHWPSGFIHFKDLSSGAGSTPSDGTRIARPSGSQYIFERDAALPVDYPDAVRYNNEGNTSVQTNYTTSLPAATLPPNTILRPVGSNSQYFWSGSGQLQPIGDTPTSQCLFIAYPQNGLAVVPADWVSAAPRCAGPVQPR